MRIERIVAGMDFSAPAIAGVSWVGEHFAPNAELVLVHVIDLPSPPRFLRTELPIPAGEIARDIGRERLTAAVAFGRSTDGILELAEHANADLIVLGRTGAGAVRATILGSTANAVLHGATCPVLVVTESRDAVVPSK